jgi:hypothetical protein
METKIKAPTRKEGHDENPKDKDKEHKLKDAFNAMGYINLAIAK